MTTASAYGQQKPLAPRLVSLLGSHGSDTVSVQEGTLLLSVPLRVIDSRKAVYPIDSYRFGYKRKGYAIEKGEARPNSTLQSAMFRKTPIPEIWKKNVSEHLQSGEEFMFFDILVKDKQGQLFLAPDIKIVIQ